MIDLYYWPTPNGHKITIFLEEAKLPYKIIPVNIGKGEQFTSEFLNIAPNNKIPAILDHQPSDGGEPIALFESGAILVYLAEKTDLFLSKNLRDRTQTLQWLFWQMGGLGPMAGQNHHFSRYASEVIPYAVNRYNKETSRLYAVLNQQLQNKEFIAGEYSIADMACYPWILLYENQNQTIDDFPNLKRWLLQIKERTPVVNAYAKGNEINQPPLSDEAKKVLFGQDANSIENKDHP